MEYFQSVTKSKSKYALVSFYQLFENEPLLSKPQPVRHFLGKSQSFTQFCHNIHQEHIHYGSILLKKNKTSNGYVITKILSHKQCDLDENQCISRQLAQKPHLICVWF